MIIGSDNERRDEPISHAAQTRIRSFKSTTYRFNRNLVSLLFKLPDGNGEFFAGEIERFCIWRKSDGFALLAKW